MRAHLSDNLAIPAYAKQSRKERNPFLEVPGQTPRRSEVLSDPGNSAPFETPDPITTLGLEAGIGTLNANGILTES